VDDLLLDSTAGNHVIPVMVIEQATALSAVSDFALGNDSIRGKSGLVNCLSKHEYVSCYSCCSRDTRTLSVPFFDLHLDSQVRPLVSLLAF
jgi:hypothetical protein